MIASWPGSRSHRGGRRRPAAPAPARARPVPAGPVVAGNHVRVHLADRGGRADAVDEGAADARGRSSASRRSTSRPAPSSTRPSCASCGSPSRSCGSGSTGEARPRGGRTVLADAEAARRVAAATRARIVLGLEAAARGDHAAPIEQLAAVVGSELVTPADRPDVYSTLGRAYAPSGRRARRWRCSSARSTSSRRVEPENIAARVRYSTYLSYALTDLGELQRAKAVVGGALRRVRRAGRPVHARAALLVARAALARAGEAARGARQLPARGGAARGDRGHASPRPRPHRVRRRDDHRRRRLGGALHHLDEAERLLGAARGRRRSRRRSGGCRHVRRGLRRSVRPRPRPQALELAGESPNERGHAWWAIAEARAAARRRPTPTTRSARRSSCSASTAPSASTPPCSASYGRFLRDAGPRARGARRLRAGRRGRLEPPGRAGGRRAVERGSAAAASGRWWVARRARTRTAAWSRGLYNSRPQKPGAPDAGERTNLAQNGQGRASTQ